MIRDQWYGVLESSEVQKEPIGVTRMGEKLVFWRNSRGKIHCAAGFQPRFSLIVLPPAYGAFATGFQEI